jgi:hypothetical protein
MSDTDRCANCGTEIVTAVGMDAYTEVTDYTTTEYSREVFCNRDCLRDAIA